MKLLNVGGIEPSADPLSLDTCVCTCGGLGAGTIGHDAHDIHTCGCGCTGPVENNLVSSAAKVY